MILSTSIIGFIESWLMITMSPLWGKFYTKLAVRKGLNTLFLIFWKYFNSTKNLTFEISEMLEFSKEVSKWMAQDDENIVAIHCKGGKGKIIFLFYFSFF